MKAILVAENGTVLHAVQLMHVSGDARRDMIEAFVAFAAYNAELADDGTPREILDVTVTF